MVPGIRVSVAYVVNEEVLAATMKVPVMQEAVGQGVGDEWCYKSK